MAAHRPNVVADVLVPIGLLLEWGAIGLLMVGLRGSSGWHSLLLDQLPLRAFYDPSLVGMAQVYGVPLLLGLLLAIQWEVLHGPLDLTRAYAFALLGSLAYLAPMAWLLDPFGDEAGMLVALALLEYLVLLPALAFAGMALVHVGQGLEAMGMPTGVAPRLATVAIAALAALATALALGQVLNFGMPQGADTYGQAATTRGLLAGRGLFQDPHFLEERVRYYPPGGIVLVALLAKVLSVDTLAVWQWLPVVLGPAAIVAAMWSLRRRAGVAAAVAVGAFALAWDQVLFVDAAGRIFAFTGAFLLVALLWGRRRAWVAIAAGLAVLSLFHFALLPVAAGGAGLAFLAQRRPASWGRKAGGRVAWGDSHMLVLVAVALALAVGALLYARIATFGSLGLGIYSEVALGATRPWGFATVLLGPILALCPWVLLSRSSGRVERVLAAVGCTAAVVVLYFVHAWSFYHRYFPELALIGVVVLFGLLLHRLVGARGVPVLAAFLLLSTAVVLVPREHAYVDLSEDVESRLELRAGVLEAIETLDPDAVVLAHPDEILNRYIPPFTGRYIFCATMGVTAERQFEVVSKPGPVARRAEVRNALAVDFLQDPSNATLEPIRAAYEVDAVVLSARTPDVDGVASRLGATVVFQDPVYVLLQLPEAR